MAVPPQAAAAPAPMPAPAASGTFSALTYNIAGLPEPLSSAVTSRRSSTTAIGAASNGYDVVNVQEDFNYHAALYAASEHPYRTATSGGAGIGSGLNTLSAFPFEGPQRVTWDRCWIGTGDCLTPKGFTLTRIRPAEGVAIDVYNLHTDAGSEANDDAARAENLRQLGRYLAERSAGRAVIVMGDTNSRYTTEGDEIAEFAAANGLRDPWVDLVRAGAAPAKGSPALHCADTAPGVDCEVVDKVLYRSGDSVTLDAVSYRNEHSLFATADGTPLSDHFPIAVDFDWTCIGECSDAEEPLPPLDAGSSDRGGSVG